jgi:hypothetical protein
MRFILRNSVTAPYFQEFMIECNSAHILEFWHLIDHFPSNCHSKLTKAAQQGTTVSVEAMREVYERLTQDALRLFYQVPSPGQACLKKAFSFRVSPFGSFLIASQMNILNLNPSCLCLHLQVCR